MVVNEKVLVREMKEAFKGWGYTVMVLDGDRWVIQSLNGWAVEIEGQDNVPNEVLALIVLHMGYLPKPERCYRVYKGDKCTCVQKEVFAVAVQNWKSFERIREETDEAPVEVRRAALVYGRRRVWQQCEDIKIGHSSKDENGKYSGGVAGDQTGKEVCTRSWYNGGWDFVARAKNPATAEKMAAACEAGCKNPNIGYDQGGRNSLRAEAKKVGYFLNLIKTPCESDCSAFMGVCVEAAGVKLPDGNGPTTRTLRKVLEATGEFDILTNPGYLSTDAYLQRGDVLCKEGSHTVMALEDGSRAGTVIAVPESDTVTVYCSVRLPLLKKGSKGPVVKNLQNMLMLHGEKLPKYGADGEFGDETGAALESFQYKNSLTADRICGPESWAALSTT